MNKRPKFTMRLSIALAVIALFAALSLQAQSSSPEDFRYDGADSSGQLTFSWKTDGDEVGAILQFTGGGISNVWLSVWLNSHSFNNERSVIQTESLTENFSDLSGKTLSFRVQTDICVERDAEGTCSAFSRSDWSTLDVSF